MSVETLTVFDFVVERGDSCTIELGPVTTKNHLGAKVPLDLTTGGLKLWLTVKKSVDDADPGVVQLTETAGITVNDPVTTDKNFATARIVEAEFADLVEFPERTTLFWDAKFELGARHETIARGRIFVVPSVGRAT